jgi:polar amino acid transport system substrate-binding protein
MIRRVNSFALFFICLFALFVTGAKADEKVSAYDRVMKTHTIRCGYALWPPAIMTKDPNTGQMGGIFYDITEAMAKNLGLSVVWAEEVSWGPNIEAGLQTGRYDLFCAPLWIHAPGAPWYSYSIPLMYSSTHLYTRVGDTRFDDNISKLNSPEYKLSMVDGEQSAVIAEKFFPKARRVALSQSSELTQMLMEVSTGKADAVFLEPSLAKDFSDKNPGKIRQATKKPFAVWPNVYGADINDEKFMRMINSALTEMLNDGEIDTIIDRYSPDRGVFMPVAKPYVLVQPEKLK